MWWVRVLEGGARKGGRAEKGSVFRLTHLSVCVVFFRNSVGLLEERGKEGDVFGLNDLSAFGW